MNESLSYFIPLLLNLSRYFLFAGIPFLIFYILFPQVFSKNKIQARLAKNKDFFREILHSLQTTLVIGAIGLAILYSPLKIYTQIYTNTADYSLWWIPLSVLLAIMLHDTYFYWLHRTVHHPTLFKRVHLLHHQSFNPSPWASYSFHFWEAVLEALVAPLILCLIPMHPIAILSFTFIAFIMNVYGHLGYEIAPRWFRYSFLFEIMNTSTHHNQHHAESRGNYGLYFRIWDRLMKTEFPNYVEEYDKIQLRRFGTKVSAKLTANKTAFMVLFFLGFGAVSGMAQTSIEGKWRDKDQGGIIQIYQEDGKYYGQVIASDNVDENELLQDKKVIILQDFEKEKDGTYCCGTIYAPRKKININAILTLKGEDKLVIKGKYGRMSGTRTWERIKS